MDSVSKNKRYAIKRLIDNDKTLIPSDLEKFKIIDLLKMIEEQKIKSKQVIRLEREFEPKSLLYYLGLEEDN